MTAEPQFLTIDDLAACLGVSTRTIRRWVAAGSLQKAPLGGRTVRIPINELHRLMGVPTRSEAMPDGSCERSE